MLLKKITCNFFVADLVVLASNLSSRIAFIQVAIWRHCIVFFDAFVASQNLVGQSLLFAKSDRKQSQKNQRFHGDVILKVATLKLTSVLVNFITGNIISVLNKRPPRQTGQRVS